MKRSIDNPIKLALVVGVGLFVSTLDAGIINIAIPTLLKQFKAPLSIVVWTITLYTLLLSATILLFGRFADRWGRLRVYMYGLLLFAGSSFLCGVSVNIWMLIIFRAIQGLSAAMMQATTIAIITTRLDKQGIIKAMGIVGSILGFGPMMAPVVGGFILSILSWRWIFWVNIPICLIGLAGCKTLPPLTEELDDKPIYYCNLILLALGLFSLLLTLSFISHARNEAYIVGLMAILLTATYGWLDQRSQHPIIPFELFKSLNFTAPIVGIITFAVGLASIFMLTPLYLEKLRHFQPWQVGLVSLSAPIGVVITSQVATRLVDRLDKLVLMFIGLSIMILTLLNLTQIVVTSEIIWFSLLLLGYGAGVGLYQIPCYLHLTQQFPASRQAFISALIRMILNLAIAFTVTIAAMLISLKVRQSPNNLLIGIHQGWWLALFSIVIAWVVMGFCLLTKQRGGKT